MLETSKLAKSKQTSCLFIFISIYTLTRLIDLTVEMYLMNRLLNCMAWNAHTFHPVEKNREGLLVYK